MPSLDEARVATSARNNDGGDMEDGNKVCARGIKSIMFVAMGGLEIS